MKKSLYSLMLMDSVVSEIDRLAVRKNTNRSNLVNQILADYVSMMTPEKRIGSIFKYMESIMTGSGDLVPLVTPNHRTMSVKSSLEYKYRPTIRYEVQLFRAPSGALGPQQPLGSPREGGRPRPPVTGERGRSPCQRNNSWWRGPSPA